MASQTLYLMLGYPGAGKTTVSKLLGELSGAVHIWADKERREFIGKPTYSHRENTELYNRLNQQADSLLSEGNSVIFDTNFSYYRDRQKLTKVADRYGAKTVLVWVTTDKLTAKLRSTKNSEKQPTRLLGNMAPEDFDRISNTLEEPKSDEEVIRVDGTKVTPQYIKSCFGLTD